MYVSSTGIRSPSPFCALCSYNCRSFAPPRSALSLHARPVASTHASISPTEALSCPFSQRPNRPLALPEALSPRRKPISPCRHLSPRPEPLSPRPKPSFAPPEAPSRPAPSPPSLPLPPTSPGPRPRTRLEALGLRAQRRVGAADLVQQLPHRRLVVLHPVADALVVRLRPARIHSFLSAVRKKAERGGSEGWRRGREDEEGRRGTGKSGR